MSIQDRERTEVSACRSVVNYIIKDAMYAPGKTTVPLNFAARSTDTCQSGFEARTRGSFVSVAAAWPQAAGAATHHVAKSLSCPADSASKQRHTASAPSIIARQQLENLSGGKGAGSGKQAAPGESREGKGSPLAERTGCSQRSPKARCSHHPWVSSC